MAGGRKKKKKKKKEPLLEPEEERRIFNEKLQNAEKDLDLMHKANADKEKEYAIELNNFNQLETDRNDVIEYLQRTLDRTLQQLTILQEQLKILLKEKEEQDSRQAAKIARMELEYKLMKESLHSEIQLLEGKLSAMEEFKLQREDLINKFKIQEEDQKKQEEKHKLEIYELEKKLIIQRNQIKLGIDRTMTELDQDLEASSKLRITATTHTIVKTNIRLNNEMEKLMHKAGNLNLENTKLKNLDYNLRMMKEMLEKQITFVFKKNEEKTKKLDKMTKEIYDMNFNKTEVYRENERNENLLKLHEKNLQSLNDGKISVKESAEKIKQMNESNLDLNNEINLMYVRKKHLKEIIKKARDWVENIIKFDKSKQLEEKMDDILDYRAIYLENVLEILMSARTIPTQERLSELGEPPIYRTGSLGIISVSLPGEAASRILSVSPSILGSIPTEIIPCEEEEEIEIESIPTKTEAVSTKSSSTWVLASSGTVPLSNLTPSLVSISTIEEVVSTESSTHQDLIDELAKEPELKEESEEEKEEEVEVEEIVEEEEKEILGEDDDDDMDTLSDLYQK